VLLLPSLAYVLLFHYQPMYGLQIAFRDYSPMLGILGSKWVGLKHFLRFIASPQFEVVVGNTLKLNLLALLCGFPLPIILALMLNDCGKLRFKKIVQNATYIPHFISMVVLIGMVMNFLSPTIGIISRLIIFLGGEPQNYLTKPEWFRPIYILSGIWQETGWGSIIYLAALAGVDPDLHEAAQIDGASRLQRIWHINLPGIQPTIITVFILRCGRIMDVGFEKVFLLQNALNLSSSEVISTYVYRIGLLGTQFSYSALIGLFNSIINFIIILSINSIIKRISTTSLW
jgi:putative aldouronate transport system permease protein